MLRGLRAVVLALAIVLSFGCSGPHHEIVHIEHPEVIDTISGAVHIRETGSKYHSAGCRYPAKGDGVIDLSIAKRRG